MDSCTMIAEREAAGLEDKIRAAVRAGATLLCGGERRGSLLLPMAENVLPDACLNEAVLNHLNVRRYPLLTSPTRKRGNNAVCLACASG